MSAPDWRRFTARFLCLAAALSAALPGPARATKLDLSSTIDLKAANYSHLITDGYRGQGQELFSENAALGFIIKNIKLERTENSTMDVGIVLNSISAGGASTGTLKAAPFRQAAARYPNVDGTPYIKEAYVRVYRFLHKKVTATFGRQSFTLGQGLTLADDGLGLPGALLEAEKFYKNLDGEVFFFRPNKDLGFVSLYGAGVQYQSNEGMWHLYHMREAGDIPATEPGGAYASQKKQFTGVRYLLNHKQLNFDGEFVLQRGSARKACGGDIDYTAHAFLIKGVWNQNLGMFGASKMRLAYGKSSGNPGQVTDKDKAFFADFGHRYKALERDGFGDITGASLFDMIQTSDTANGMPHGVSGLNVINLGADIPYKKLVISADFYNFRAAQNAGGGSKQLGTELDLRAAYSMGDNLRLKAVYAVFKPLSLYTGLDPVRLISMALSAKF